MSSREVKVFNVRPGTTNFGELNRKLVSDKVYETGILEKLFPRSVVKGHVHKEIVVKNGKVDVELELIGPGIGDAIGAISKPFIHVGCIAVALMPHGRNLEGQAHLVLRDGRMLSGKDVLCRFKCDLSKRLSAFAEFPNYFVSTEDLLGGFTFQLSVLSDNTGFKDGTHPFSVQLTTILRGCDESMEMRYALSSLGQGAYQPVLNTKAETGLAPRIKYRTNEVTSVMPEVYETIKKLNLSHNGDLHKEGRDEGDREDSAPNWGITGGET
nr:MAG: movement protein [Grapevine virus M]